MAKAEDGGPAFPNTATFKVTPGMTLRDWFAGQALAGLLASEFDALPQRFARGAYEMADAMLDARSR